MSNFEMHIVHLNSLINKWFEMSHDISFAFQKRNLLIILVTFNLSKISIRSSIINILNFDIEYSVVR